MRKRPGQFSKQPPPEVPFDLIRARRLCSTLVKSEHYAVLKEISSRIVAAYTSPPPVGQSAFSLLPGYLISNIVRDVQEQFFQIIESEAALAQDQ